MTRTHTNCHPRGHGVAMLSMDSRGPISRSGARGGLVGTSPTMTKRVAQKLIGVSPEGSVGESHDTHGHLHSNVIPASWQSHASHGRPGPTTRFGTGAFSEAWRTWILAWMTAFAAMTKVGRRSGNASGQRDPGRVDRMTRDLLQLSSSGSWSSHAQYGLPRPQLSAGRRDAVAEASRHLPLRSRVAKWILGTRPRMTGWRCAQCWILIAASRALSGRR